MKFYSVLFLVLLLAPYAFTKTDILQMIETSDEGQEVLDSVYLQVGLEGKRLNVAAVSGRLRQIAKSAREIRASYNAAKKQNHKDCKQSVKALSSRYRNFISFNIEASAHLRHQLKVAKSNNVVIQRLKDELQQQGRFEGMSRSNARAWKKFWAAQRQGNKNALRIVERLRTHVSSLHRRNRRTALVELPEDYTTTLNEISKEFVANNNELNGLRPVIENLLQVVSEKRHLRKTTSRNAVRRLLERVADLLHENSNTFHEENEHQNEILSHLGQLYADRAHRAKVSLRHAVGAAQVIQKSINWLRGSVAGSQNLTNHAKNIVDLKRTECRSVRHFINVQRVRLNRIVETCNQTLEVVSDRFGQVKAAVLKRK